MTPPQEGGISPGDAYRTTAAAGVVLCVGEALIALTPTPAPCERPPTWRFLPPGPN